MPKSIPGVMREFRSGKLHSGSSAGPKVTNPKQAVAIAISEQKQMAKPMHPSMRQRAQLVKTSHAHLTATVPGFTAMPKQQRMQAVQAHVRSRLGKR